VPDVGDLVTATLTVSPFSGSTAATIVVYKPDGSTASASTPTTADSGATWTATFTTDTTGWWLIKWTVTGTGAGIEYQRVFVPVSPVAGTAPLYASLEQIKARMQITHADDDDLLGDALDSASREIDKFCGRRFYADALATARAYYPATSCRVRVDDFYETASLVVKTDADGDGVFETTLATTGYFPTPLNGVVDGESGWPYYDIETITSGALPTSTRRAPIQVTAKWGWAAVPRPVYQACLIIAQANYKLKDVAFGAAGVGDLGIVTIRQVPAAMAKLSPYRRDPVLVA